MTPPLGNNNNTQTVGFEMSDGLLENNLNYILKFYLTI
jgi:hypothetical protein